MTPEGELSTLTTMEGKEPHSVVVDKLDTIYFTTGDCIWKLSPVGVVTLMAGGQGLFGTCLSMTLVESCLIIADQDRHRIRKFDLKENSLTVLAGCGSPGHSNAGCYTSFTSPSHVLVAHMGNVVVAESHDLRLISGFDAGMVSPFVGSSKLGFSDGHGEFAAFSFPKNIVRDPKTGNIFVADEQNSCIRCVTPERLVYTVAGSPTVGTTDGRGEEAKFWAPYGLALALDGTLFVSDICKNTIRRIHFEEIPQARGEGRATEAAETKQQAPEASRKAEEEAKPIRGKKQAAKEVAKTEPKKRAKKVEAEESPKAVTGRRSTRSTKK
jgi:DNA-binding beta-propeller fold protein YncE